MVSDLGKVQVERLPQSVVRKIERRASRVALIGVRAMLQMGMPRDTVVEALTEMIGRFNEQDAEESDD